MAGVPFGFYVVTGFILSIWAVFIGSISRVVAVSDHGFTLRTLFGRSYDLSWIDLRSPAQRFETFWPRLLVKRRSSFLTVWSAFIVLPRMDPIYSTFVELLETHVGIRTVERLSDL